MSSPSHPPRHDLAVILGLLVLVLFVSPLTDWAGKLPMPWYAAYAAWGLIVLLAALIAMRNRQDEP